MSRLIISFVLALFSHLYLFQFKLDIDKNIPPRLISDLSVSVTLNQNLEKQVDDSKQGALKTEKKLETERTSVVSHPVPPQTATSPPKPEAEPTPIPKTIKPSGSKIKKTRKEAELPQVKEMKPVATVKSVVVDTKEKAVKKVEHLNNPVSSKGVVSEQGETSPSTASSSSVIKAQPLYQYNPKPEYPSLARRRGWEGVVMLQVDVTKKGEVASVRLHESCGYKILDKSAVRAVKKWRFLPGTRDGKQTLSTVLIPVHFILKK